MVRYGLGRLGQVRTRSGTLGVIRNGSQDPRGVPERVKGSSGRSETGRGTLEEVRDGSGDLGYVRGGSGDPWRGMGGVRLPR